MNNIIFYLIGFFVVIYIARMLGERAMKTSQYRTESGFNRLV